MKNKLTALLILGIIISAPILSKAQEVTKLRFGIGFQVATPTSDLKDTHQLGLGGDIRLTKGILPNVEVTFTTGIVSFFPKNNNKTSTIRFDAVNFVPLKLGGRYFFSKILYGTADAGVNFFTTSNLEISPLGFIIAPKEKSAKYFTYTLGAGARFGDFDMGLRYEDTKLAQFIALRLGYDF